ncbi:MAG TPA: type IV secretion system DNA-binding domain-containing protein [Patescibacteria group bacterium]|nr:type IV secretion system DNA-binding domain-containing protein [Patescibacteria group bacterium]
MNQPILFSDNITGIMFSLLMGLAGLIVFSLLAWLFIYVVFIWWKYRNREQDALNSTLLQVAVPRDNEIKIDTAEQLFAGLAAIRKSGRLSFLKPQPHLAFEIVGTPGDIRYYIHVPNKLRDFVEKQINGAYPDAQIVEVNDSAARQRSENVLGGEYNIFSESGKVSFASLSFKNSDYLPIKNFKDLPVDAMASLTSTLAKMGQGEGIAMQILISPADSKWKSEGKSYVSKTKKAESNPEKATYKVDAKELEGIENKLSKPGFNATIRVVVSSSSKEAADLHLGNIINSFSQFSGANYFKKNKLFLGGIMKGAFITDFIYRYWPLWGQTSVLSSEELATMYHFPNKAVATPGIHWVNSKRAPAPSTIPTEGLFLGTSSFRGLTRTINMSLEDRQRHMYIVGKTGTGKTEFLKRMILQDIKAGQGIAVIDPHGDLVEDILELMPPERAEDVILFDPSDIERPLAVNMLEAKTEQQKHLVVTSIIGLMYKLFDPNKTGIIGPRFEHAVRNAMLTVMAEPGSTFIEVMRVLTDPTFVQELLPKVDDPIVRRYWTDQIAQTSDFHKSEVLDYITSKFGRFVTNKMIRNIIGQSNSAFDFRKVMDEQKILLINLSKGKIGEENSSFLGLVLVPKILVAAMSRADMPMEQRKDFFLYVDEFQNFATPDFAQILSEARKYRLNLTVANQFIGQMDEEIKNAIFGNVGTIASFRVGVTDANYLQHEYTPTFSEADLINIDKFNAYLRTVVNGEPVPPFSIETTPDFAAQAKEKNPRVAELVKELSRLKFGKDMKVVEAEIQERARL